jgi:zinc transporter
MSEVHGHILLAYNFNGDGSASHLKNKEVGVELKNKTLAWVHLDANHPRTSNWLKKEVSYLDQIIIDALLADETRPRLVEYESGSLVILRGVNLNENSKPEDMVSIRMWVDSQRIITLQRREVKGIKEIEERLKNGIGPKTAGEFVSTLCYELSDHLQFFIDYLKETAEEVEEKTIDKTFDDQLRENVITIKKQAIMFRRHIAPQKEVVGCLKNCKQNWLTNLNRRHLQENYDHLYRYIENLEEVKERSQVVHEEMVNAVSRKLNKNMYFLSVVAAIFMPLTFVTGLFGMNVGGIPLNVSQFGFYVISGVLTLLVVLQILISKKNNWF